MILVISGCLTMTYVSANYTRLNLSPTTWLFIQSLSLYIAYLTFQTIFFDRFIACFKIKGNVGFFIAIIDFIGYVGTVSLLSIKEMLQIKLEWFALFNKMAMTVGILGTVLFSIDCIQIFRRYQMTNEKKQNAELEDCSIDSQYGLI